MSSKGRIVSAAAMAATACLLTACGTASSTTVTPPASSPVSASPLASSGSNLDAAVRTTDNSSLGTIVVDGSGRTLYRFDKDSDSPPTSNCTGSCAQLWPPVLVGTQITLSGIDRSLLGTIKRSDGTVQLTLNGWPLYRYAGDSAPGQINGEGVGGIWFAVRPTGAKALSASSSRAGAATSGASGTSSGGTSGAAGTSGASGTSGGSTSGNNGSGGSAGGTGSSGGTSGGGTGGYGY